MLTTLILLFAPSFLLPLAALALRRGFSPSAGRACPLDLCQPDVAADGREYAPRSARECPPRIARRPSRRMAWRRLIVGLSGLRLNPLTPYRALSLAAVLSLIVPLGVPAPALAAPRPAGDGRDTSPARVPVQALPKWFVPAASLPAPLLQPLLQPPASGLAVEMVGTTELFMDFNEWCSGNPSQAGPDGGWYPIRVTNTTTETYTGLELRVTSPVSLTIDDGTRYLGTLEPGESVDLFVFVDYYQLRDWLPCSNSDPPITYNEPFTITIRSLNGGMSGTLTFTDTFRAEGMTSAQAGGVYVSHELGPGVYVGQIITMEVVYGFGQNPAGSPLFIQPAGNWDFLDQCFRLVGTEVTASDVDGVTAGVTNTLWFSNTDTGPGSTITMLYYLEILCSEGATESAPWSEITSGNDQKYNCSGYGGDNIITITQPISGVIGVSKWVTPTILPQGGVATYSVRFQNVVTVPILVNVITDALPTGVTYGGVTASSDIMAGNSSISPTVGATGTLVWYGIPQVSYLVPASGTVTAGVPGYIDLIYTATVTSTEGMYTNWVTAVVGKETTDPVSATVRVGQVADLETAKSANPDAVVAGGTLTYTLVYTNNGPSDAQNVTITDTLPTGVTFGGMVSVAPPLFGPTQTGQLLTWYTPTLAAGAWGSIVFTVTVGADAGSTITNSVVITSSTPDLDPGDNQDVVTTTVLFTNVWVQKDVEPVTPVRPGDVVTWTITYGNQGAAPATGGIHHRYAGARDDLRWGGERSSAHRRPDGDAAIPDLVHADAGSRGLGHHRLYRDGQRRHLTGGGVDQHRRHHHHHAGDRYDG